MTPDTYITMTYRALSDWDSSAASFFGIEEVGDNNGRETDWKH